MTSKSRRPAATSASSPGRSEIREAPDDTPRGPVAHVTAAPPAATTTGSVAILEGKLRVRRAEALMTKGEAYSLAAQLESLAHEFEAKRDELRRAWKKTLRRIQSLEAAIEADEATLTLLRSEARSTSAMPGSEVMR